MLLQKLSVDTFALNYLLENGFGGDNIMRYYKGDLPAIYNINEFGYQSWTTSNGVVVYIKYCSGFKSYPERDAAMRKISTDTIGFPMTYAGGGSGTTENLLRSLADEHGKVNVMQVIALGRNTCDGFDPRIQRLLYSDDGRQALMSLLETLYPK